MWTVTFLCTFNRFSNGTLVGPIAVTKNQRTKNLYRQHERPYTDDNGVRSPLFGRADHERTRTYFRGVSLPPPDRRGLLLVSACTRRSRTNGYHSSSTIVIINTPKRYQWRIICLIRIGQCVNVNSSYLAKKYVFFYRVSSLRRWLCRRMPTMTDSQTTNVGDGRITKKNYFVNNSFLTFLVW